jgi:hypothetical protein
MKFNMGCGARKLPGFVNVDAIAACAPDEVFDLETTPWPWPSGVAEEIRFIHSLEHMGGDSKVFLAIMVEIYRIAADGCLVYIHVPHPRHDDFLGDPTHVRPITPQMMALFDREFCDQILAKGAPNTPLAHYLGVDFAKVHAEMVLEEPYFSQLKSGELNRETVEQLIKTQSNVVQEIRLVLRIRKPQPETPQRAPGAS